MVSLPHMGPCTVRCPHHSDVGRVLCMHSKRMHLSLAVVLRCCEKGAAANEAAQGYSTGAWEGFRHAHPDGDATPSASSTAAAAAVARSRAAANARAQPAASSTLRPRDGQPASSGSGRGLPPRQLRVERAENGSMGGAGTRNAFHVPALCAYTAECLLRSAVKSILAPVVLACKAILTAAVQLRVFVSEPLRGRYPLQSGACCCCQGARRTAAQ